MDVVIEGKDIEQKESYIWNIKRFEDYSKKFLSFKQMLNLKSKFKIFHLKDY